LAVEPVPPVGDLGPGLDRPGVPLGVVETGRTGGLRGEVGGGDEGAADAVAQLERDVLAGDGAAQSSAYGEFRHAADLKGRGAVEDGRRAARGHRRGTELGPRPRDGV